MKITRDAELLLLLRPPHPVTPLPPPSKRKSKSKSESKAAANDIAPLGARALIPVGRLGRSIEVRASMLDLNPRLGCNRRNVSLPVSERFLLVAWTAWLRPVAATAAAADLVAVAVAAPIAVAVAVAVVVAVAASARRNMVGFR